MDRAIQYKNNNTFYNAGPCRYLRYKAAHQCFEAGQPWCWVLKRNLYIRNYFQEMEENKEERRKGSKKKQGRKAGGVNVDKGKHN
jgi:hypothetical protein